MAATEVSDSSRDPRRRTQVDDASHVSKRPASRSPVGAEKPLAKLPRPNKGSATPNSGVEYRRTAHGSGAPPPPPPPVTMSPASPPGSRRSSLQASLPSRPNGARHSEGRLALEASNSPQAQYLALMNAYHSASMDLAASRLRHTNLKALAARVSTNYGAIKEDLQLFPALNENMKHATVGADHRVEEEEKVLERCSAAQQEALQAVIALQWSSLSTQSSPTLQAELKQLASGQKDMMNQLDQYKDDLRKANSKIDNMSTAYNNLSASYNNMSTSFGSIRSTVDTLSTSVSTLSTMKTKVGNMGSTIDSMQSTTDTLQSTVNTLQSKVQSIGAAVEAQVSSNDKRITALEEKVEDLEENQEEAHTKLGNEVETQLKESAETAIELVKTEIRRLEQEYNADIAIQNHNAKTINELQADKASKEELMKTQSDLAQLSETVRQFKNQPTAKELNGNAGGLAQFQPILPPGDEPTEEQRPRIDRMEQEILVLQNVTQLHTQQYHNLTTDVITQQMCDQLSNMYPAAKDFQIAVNALHARLNEYNTTLTEVKLKTEMHDEAVAQGQQKFQDHGADIKGLNGQMAYMSESLKQAVKEAARKSYHQ